MISQTQITKRCFSTHYTRPRCPARLVRQFQDSFHLPSYSFPYSFSSNFLTSKSMIVTVLSGQYICQQASVEFLFTTHGRRKLFQQHSSLASISLALALQGLPAINKKQFCLYGILTAFSLIIKTVECTLSV